MNYLVYRFSIIRNIQCHIRVLDLFPPNFSSPFFSSPFFHNVLGHLGGLVDHNHMSSKT